MTDVSTVVPLVSEGLAIHVDSPTSYRQRRYRIHGMLVSIQLCKSMEDERRSMIRVVRVGGEQF